jgi:hypothetical protein
VREGRRKEMEIEKIHRGESARGRDKRNRVRICEREKEKRNREREGGRKKSENLRVDRRIRIGTEINKITDEDKDREKKSKDGKMKR